MKRKILLGILTAFTMLIPARVYCHGINVMAHWEGSEVHTDSFFADGKPMVNARGEAYDRTGVLVAEGVTDETGTWDFPNPGRGDLRIVVTASSGHRGEVLLQVKSGGNASEDMAQLKAIQDDILELQRLVGKPGLAEILGGLGWIVGLAGAYLWGVSRGRGDR